MLKDPSKKYRPFPPIELTNRQWPNRTLTRAPLWCSVDLRDGNQALAVPMNVSQKLEMFQALVKCGFKEIEVGFPSASNTEFAFNRRLIEEHRAPDDVWLQVLVQAREDLIERTFESLAGARRAIIHLYNSTSPAQRRVVFDLSRDEIIQLAVRGATLIQERLPQLKHTEVLLQYSPESFSATEVEFARDISEAVMEVWKPTPGHKMILNLPNTVEVAMPNVYADQIEWVGRNIKNRDSLIISLHTHNDRCTGMTVPPRQPYAGELVFTAFSGSHQDAIRKGLNEWAGRRQTHWDVPYLTIDPADIGREYREVIRVNSQSGKGGVAYLLESEFGIALPKEMQREFGPIANDEVDRLGREVSGAELKAMFWREYIERVMPWELRGFETESHNGTVRCRARLLRDDQPVEFSGEGNG